MLRRKNRRSKKSLIGSNNVARLSAIEILESRQLLTTSGYLQIPLAADQAGAALVQDANLQNAWGIAVSPSGGPVWVADNGTNQASQYEGAVSGTPFGATTSVAVPAGSPTAIAFNQTFDFTVGSGSTAAPALFLIASQNGEIDGWNSLMGNQAQKAVSDSGAEFTGLAVANNGTNSFLYAADFHNGKIDVFDSSFNATTLSATAFTDSSLPSGYAPYNIQLVNGQLYVTYAPQDAAKQNPVPGGGNGIIDIYNLDGSFVKQLISGGDLNDPYGMAMAPAGFGDFAGDLLVANGGDGHILAYNMTGPTAGPTASFAGDLQLGPNGSAITITGVRGLSFGNGSSAGDSTTLFYTAANGTHGQFGEILNAFQQPLVVVPTTISAAQGQSFSGTLATVSDSGSSLAASNFIVNINWGDGTTTSGSVASNGNGGFNITGAHTYATAGNRQVTITASDSSNNNASATATATVTDPSFSPSGTTFSATEGQAFNAAVGGFSDPTGPGTAGQYSATINWGDGTSSTGTVTLASADTFNVTGSHTYTSVGSFSASAVVSEVNGTTTAAIGTVNSTASVIDPNTLTAAAATFAATEGTSTTATVATFTDSNASATANLFTASIDWGDGTTASSGTVTKGNDGVFTVTGSHAYAENGTLTATVNVSDTPGTATASATSTANVADGNTLTAQPMTVVANVGQTFSGVVATFSDTNSLVRAADFTATIDWGDSNSSTGTVTAANGVLTVTGSHSYTTGGVSDPVTVVVTENHPGTASATANSTAVVPAGDVSGTGATITSTAGSASSSQTLATFTPKAGDNATTFTATVDWGDGSSFSAASVTATGSGSFNVVGSHTYATPGNFTPDVIVYEATGTGSATPAVAIAATANVVSPLTITAQTITGKEHASTTYTVATFTDSQTAVTASDFSASIDWGDGSSASAASVTLNGGVFTVTGSHSFVDAGTFDVAVTVTQGAPTTFSTSASATATISQDDSFTASAASLTATVGSAFSGTVATFTDSDTQTSAAQLTAVISWGDGNDSAGTVTGSDGQFAVSGSHTYSKDGSFPLSVTIENSSSLPGSTESVATGTAAVSPGSNFTATGTTITPTEGQAFSGTVATFVDTGSTNAASAFTATIQWGDGSSSTGTVTGSSGSYTVSGNHTYTDGGTHQMTVQVVETAVSATVSTTSTADVSGTDTLTSTGMTISPTAGSTFTGAVAGFTDSNTAAAASDFTATINWGDGSSTTAGTVTGSNGAFTVTGAHSYSNTGTSTVTVTLSDVNLSSISSTATSTAEVTPSTTTTGTSTGTSTGTMSGMVFNDLSVSGAFQTGDPGLAGRTVFLNNDGSGTADGTNPQTTTDANGNFTFSGLAPGNYTVMEVIPTNHGVTLTTKVQTLSITAGLNVTGVDIGNVITSNVVPVQVSVTGPPAASDANTAYIDALFQTILGHAPDANGLAFWQQQMSSGTSRAAVAQGIWDSTEHRTEEVVAFYHEFLNRDPDPAGEQFWINAFSSWGTEQLETVGFLAATPEYQNLHSGNTAFVDALYNDIDQRPADSAGESTWVSQLGNGATPTQVALEFVFAQESATDLVNAFYSAFLHRTADAASLQMWVGDLTSKSMTAEQVAIQLLASDEYFSRVTGSQAPAITSAASTSFSIGTAGSFTVTTSGMPVGTITESGTLPTGVTFTDNGNGTATLAGTPTAGGTFDLTLSVNNGVGAAATQNFVLTVGSAPSITSANTVTFTAGTAGSFTVATTGTPNAAITETGTLPSGITLTDNGNGTATLSGTPATGTGGVHDFTINANNGVGTAASQSFALLINAAPAITSANSTSFASGTPQTFTVQTSGFPTAAITESGSLPNGVTLTDNNNGTATLASTSAAAAGTYTFTINASNNIGTAASQSFTLTIGTPAAITSAASTTFTAGTVGTFTVTTSGSPSPAITETGALPNGVTLTDNGNGSATLTSTSAALPGIYQFTINANNGIGSGGTQTFTLTIGQAPQFTSTASTGFTTGTGGTFTITTSGTPTAAITETGTLPTGVTLTDNKNGTATLAATSATPAGTYQFTLNATNEIGTPASQPFTLTVGTPPQITSDSSATFTAGTAGSFTVTTTGSPTAAITETGTLPNGVTLVDNGDGTATLSSTSAAAAGTYQFTINAKNGVGTGASQPFTLTIS
jgi:large repetitive protein